MTKGRRKNALAFEPTDEQRREVLLLTGYRMKPEHIGLLLRHPLTGLPLGEHTIRQLFPHELAAGKAMVDAKVAESLYKKAIGNGPQAVTAATFWAKANMGWSERPESSDPAALPAGVLVVPTAVSPSSWVAEQQQKNAKKKPPQTVGLKK